MPFLMKFLLTQILNRVMKNSFKKLLIPLSLFSLVCSAQKYVPENNQDVGNIVFDPKIDDPNFKVCNPGKSYQYYYFSDGLSYKGEKYEILKLWKQTQKPTLNSNETGYISIRFLVNCEGKTGLFRIQQFNSNYEEVSFDTDLVNLTLNFVKKLSGWNTLVYKGNNPEYKGKSFDYYQYLTFKIEQGVVTEILP